MSHLKTSLPACALALLLGLFALTPAHAASRIVRVGVYENEPKVFLDENGAPSGIFIELLEAIAQDEGWELEYVPGTWDEGLSRLSSGEIDLMPDVAYTPERDEQYDFNRQRVAESWSYVYMTDGGGVDGISDLEGMRSRCSRIDPGGCTRAKSPRFWHRCHIVRRLLRNAFELTFDGDADARWPTLLRRLMRQRSTDSRSPHRLGEARSHYAAGRGQCRALTAIDHYLTRGSTSRARVLHDSRALMRAMAVGAHAAHQARWLVGVALACSLPWW